jgi:hypothetical protein
VAEALIRQVDGAHGRRFSSTLDWWLGRDCHVMPSPEWP